MGKERRGWTVLRSMSEKELKDEWKNLSLEVEQMSNWVGTIKNDNEYDSYMDEFGNLLDDIQGIRNATDHIYFKSYSK